MTDVGDGMVVAVGDLRFQTAVDSLMDGLA